MSSEYQREKTKKLSAESANVICERTYMSYIYRKHADDIARAIARAADDGRSCKEGERVAGDSMAIGEHGFPSSRVR